MGAMHRRWRLLLGLLLAAASSGGCPPTAADATAPVCMTDDECDDGLSCTMNTCSENQCLTEVVGGRCLIDGACHLDGAQHPSDGCQACDADADSVGWSHVCGGGGDASGSDAGTADDADSPSDAAGPEDPDDQPTDTVAPPADSVDSSDDGDAAPGDAVDPASDTSDPSNDAVVPPTDAGPPTNPCDSSIPITTAPYATNVSLNDADDTLVFIEGECDGVTASDGNGTADRTWEFIAPAEGTWSISVGTGFDAALYLTEVCPLETPDCIDVVSLTPDAPIDPLLVELAAGTSLFITVEALGPPGSVELEVSLVPDREPTCIPGSCGADGCGGQCGCGSDAVCAAGSCVVVGEDLDCLHTVDCVTLVCQGDASCTDQCLAKAGGSDASALQLLTCYDQQDCSPDDPCFTLECDWAWMQCAELQPGEGSCHWLAYEAFGDCELSDLTCIAANIHSAAPASQALFVSRLLCALSECPDGDISCVHVALSEGPCVGYEYDCFSEPCIGNCAGKECGDDWCGISCGDCADGTQCAGGQCLAPTAEMCCGEQSATGCVANPACEQCVCDEYAFCCESEWNHICANAANSTAVCGQPDICGCCAPACEDKVCGPDGCGGSCGSCGPDLGCDDGACVPVAGLEGHTCDNPIPIEVGTPVSGVLEATYNAFESVIPCGNEPGTLDDGPDQVYAFTAPLAGWYPAHFSANDWPGAVHLLADCSDTTSCQGVISSAPFGGVRWYAPQGSTWFLVVESVLTEIGAYELLIEEPCIPDCAGSTCGDDGCGGSCGICGLDEACAAGSCAPIGSAPAERGQTLLLFTFVK